MPSTVLFENSFEKNNDKKIQKNKTVLNIVETNEENCWCCKSSEHKISECSDFKQKKINARWQLVLQNKLCICCLSGGHRASACLKKISCGIDKCKKEHNKLLHNHNPTKKEEKSSDLVAHASHEESKVSLRILPVVLTGPLGKVSTVALLDEGSTLTLIDAKVAEALGTCGPTVPLCLSWTNGINRKEEESQRVTVKVSSEKSGSKSYTMRNVRTIEDLALPIHHLNMERLREEWPHLNKIPFKSIHGKR
ncbi:unnamed protein product, partial [Allacma fusca]